MTTGATPAGRIDSNTSAGGGGSTQNGVPRVPSLRKRKDFSATLLSQGGQPLSDCWVFIEIETTVTDAGRSTTWEGRITSLSEPQHAYGGLYGLRPKDGQDTARVDVLRGAEARLGITSDEYQFRGLSDPPQIP